MARFQDNGVTMWEDTHRFYIGPGETYQFVFHYDANENMDVFSYCVNPATYIETIQSILMVLERYNEHPFLFLTFRFFT